MIFLQNGKSDFPLSVCIQCVGLLICRWSFLFKSFLKFVLIDNIFNFPRIYLCVLLLFYFIFSFQLFGHLWALLLKIIHLSWILRNSFPLFLIYFLSFVFISLLLRLIIWMLAHLFLACISLRFSISSVSFIAALWKVSPLSLCLSYYF